jgi:phosphate transport system substrate-binding protein
MRRSFWVGLGAIPVLFGVTAAAAELSINAAGATFPAAIYQKWFDEFKEAKINYQALGSGAGIQQLTQGTVDFGASDMPMKDEQIAAMKVKPLHFPTVLGAVVPVYNIPGVPTDLKLTQDALAGIYLGQIKKWNDPKIVAENKGVKLPDAEIITVHRSDGSGTTFIFTEYLGKISSTWKSKVGANSSVSWPVSGLAGKGNDGVAGMVKQTPGSVGYVELVYAAKNNMTMAMVRNKAGNYVKASVTSVTAAASATANQIPADFRVSITDPPGADAYPISSFTYLLIPSKIDNPAKKKALVDFLGWMLTTGQKDAPGLDYAPLPDKIVAKEKAQIAAVK